MKEIKLYRFVARAQYQRKMHGVFRGLDFEKAGVPDGDYEEIMTAINSNLPLPNICMLNTVSWFTQNGYEKFHDNVIKLLELYQKYNPNYIKEWDILELRIKSNNPNIMYQDCYQVVLTS